MAKDDDVDWLPSQRPKKSLPKNFSLLLAKKKKSKGKKKVEFRCSECRKRFVDSTALKKHQRRHGMNKIAQR